MKAAVFLLILIGLLWICRRPSREALTRTVDVVFGAPKKFDNGRTLTDEERAKLFYSIEIRRGDTVLNESTTEFSEVFNAEDGRVGVTVPLDIEINDGDQLIARVQAGWYSRITREHGRFGTRHRRSVRTSRTTTSDHAGVRSRNHLDRPYASRLHRETRPNVFQR